jgi:uncharacterized protein RhaS with RHS repeats
LYYFNARWYDPELGRFITEDPIKDGLNWFAYVNNNPLRYVDPTGLMSTDQDEYEENKSYESENPEQIIGEPWPETSTDESENDQDLAQSTSENQNETENESQSQDSGNAENAENDNSEQTDKKQESTNPFMTWLEKPAGAPLSDNEAKVQIGVGSGEMVLGAGGIVVAGTATTVGGAYGIFPALWTLADGANLISEAKNNTKANPGDMFIKLASPMINMGKIDFVVPLP